MPAIGAFHAFYWRAKANPPPTPPGPSKGGYPGWQASVVGLGLGVFQPWYERFVRWLRLWRQRARVTREEVALLERLTCLTDNEHLVLGRVLRALESPAYYAATEAVRETARTIGFANPQAWKPYSHMLKANAGRAENVFRHVKACERTRSLVSVDLTNPEVNLVVELAYTGYAVKGRYFD